MPSPVGHLLGGVIVGLTCLPAARNTGTTLREHGLAGIPPRVALGLCAAAAVLPDLDFLWGRHNMETHSLGAALMAGGLVFAGTKGRDPRLAIAVTLAWASHVLFDWLGSDDTQPLGVMAFWPLTSAFYFADAYVFDAISRRYWLPNFWRHNAGALAKEVAMLGPLAMALAWLKVKKPRKSGLY